ncbi:MAG: hypothetical protein WD492_18695 [Alkalispirochaeta sp.]
MQRNDNIRDHEIGLHEYLRDQDARLSSDDLTVLEVMLQEELSRQHTDAFNVIRLIERIQDGLYRQHPGFDTGSAKTVDNYFEMMPERIGLPKQTVSRIRVSANAYLRHTMDFEIYGVDPREGVSKLAFLEQALENHPGKKAEVFEHFGNDTVRAFEEYARSAEATEDYGPKRPPKEPSSMTGYSVSPRLIEAGALEEDHRMIAEAMTRRNRVIVLACPTNDHVDSLQRRVEEYRRNVIQQLTSGAGTNLPDTEPLNVPTGGNLFDIEEAIKRYQGKDQFSKAKVAVGVYRVSSEDGLIRQWRSQGFNTVRAYCDRRLGIGSEYSWYLRIGTAIMRYDSELKAAGFTMNGQLYKLAYLEAALERAVTEEEKRVVFRRLRTDSYRAFKAFATGDAPINDTPVMFRAAVVNRATRAIKMLNTIKMRGEIPAILEIQDQTEEAMIRAFDAETRPSWGTQGTNTDSFVA